MTAILPLPDIAALCLDGYEPIVIDQAENRALCVTMGIEPDREGRAHPSYFYTATQVGMGLTVAELCAACNFDVADGPMMATSGARFHAELLIGKPYLVRGRVISLLRKHSRKLGVMDLLDFRLWLETMDGSPVVETHNVWVLPRGAKPT